MHQQQEPVIRFLGPPKPIGEFETIRRRRYSFGSQVHLLAAGIMARNGAPEAHRSHKLLLKHLAGMYVFQFAHVHYLNRTQPPNCPYGDVRNHQTLEL